MATIVYILARCGSSEAELAFIDTRKACLESLSNKMVTSSGIEITDVMQLFHGDGPQQEFQSGEKKGGNTGCSGCKANAPSFWFKGLF